MGGLAGRGGELAFMMAPSPLTGRGVWPRFRHLSPRAGFNMAGVSWCLAVDGARRGGGEGEGTQVGGKKTKKKQTKKNKHARREIQHASEQKNLDVSACGERLPRAPGSV